MKMDAIVTYVDGLDPLWQKDYETAVGEKILDKRFRDWGTLKYQFRGIACRSWTVSTLWYPARARCRRG